MMARFIRDERGATAIEYALIGSLIFMVIIASVSAIGVNLTPIFAAVAAAL